jgi:hypothetical protein
VWRELFVDKHDLVKLQTTQNDAKSGVERYIYDCLPISVNAFRFSFVTVDFNHYAEPCTHFFKLAIAAKRVIEQCPIIVEEFLIDRNICDIDYSVIDNLLSRNATSIELCQCVFKLYLLQFLFGTNSELLLCVENFVNQCLPNFQLLRMIV